MEHCIKEANIAALNTEMENMKGWQKAQNGSIVRVEEKVDKLIFWQMTTAVGFIITVVIGVIAVTMKQ